jgi:integrase
MFMSWRICPSHRRFEPLTADEARHFLKAARQDKFRALWELALRAGLRRGELLGLTWADLDPAAGTLNIRRSLQHNLAGGLTLLPTKTRAAERRIALPTTCLAALEEHRLEQERQRTAAGVRWRENGLIFTTGVGTPFDANDIARRFTGLFDQAGIRRVRFHDLRHTCATLLLEQGVQLVTIKELLGHANIGITAQVYAHVRLRLQHDAINQLTDVLQDGGAPEDPGGHSPSQLTTPRRDARSPHHEPRVGVSGVRRRCRQRCRQDATREAPTLFNRHACGGQ